MNKKKKIIIIIGIIIIIILLIYLIWDYTPLIKMAVTNIILGTEKCTSSICLNSESYKLKVKKDEEIYVYSDVDHPLLGATVITR